MRDHGQNGRCIRFASSSALQTRTLPSSRGVSTLQLASFSDGFFTSKLIVAPKLIEMTGVPARWLTRLPFDSNRSWLSTRTRREGVRGKSGKSAGEKV